MRGGVLALLLMVGAGCWSTDELVAACVDAGRCVSADASVAPDAGGVDAGTDAGVVDAGAVDSGVDAGPLDGGTDAGTDAGVVDAGMVDSGFDAGPLDGGMDAGAFDSGVGDAGTDAGRADSGLPFWMIDFATYQAALERITDAGPATPTISTQLPPLENCCIGSVLEVAGTVLTFARPGGSNSQGVRFSGADGGSWVVLQNTTPGYRVQASALDPDGGVHTVALDSNQLRWLAPNGTLQPGREIPDAGGFTNLLPTARGFLLVPKPENASVSVRLVPFAAAAPLVVSNSLAASSCGNPTATDTWRSATLLPSGEVLMLPSHPGFALTVSFPSDGGLHLSCAPGPVGEFVRGVVTKEGAVLAIPRVGNVAPFVGTPGSFITLPGSGVDSYRGATWFGDGRIVPAPGDWNGLAFVTPIAGSSVDTAPSMTEPFASSYREIIAMPHGRVLITPDGTNGSILVESHRPGLPLEVLLSPWVNHR